MPDSIVIHGLDHLEVVLAAKAEALHAAAIIEVAEEAELIRQDAQHGAPRLTGDLQEHVDVEVQGTKAKVRSTSRHAGFVEHGTFKDNAQPYMHPAAERSRARLPRRAENLRAVLET